MYKFLQRLSQLISERAAHQKKPECACCGRCCESFGGHLTTSPHDLERWRREGRDDLLRRTNRLGWIWVDPQTKELLERCPFILKTDEQRSYCAIQDTKPDICRDYPTLAHGRRCLSGINF
jgi:Fe-S-cluster containining protein